MTHFPDIHQRAETLVRESRGRLTLREAYQELNRRAQVASGCSGPHGPVEVRAAIR